MDSSIVLENDMLLRQSKDFLREQRIKLENKENIYKKLEELNELIDSNGKKLDEMIRAATVLGNVADEHTKQTLDVVTSIINSALAQMFKEDKRRVVLKQEMWKNQYAHYKVELHTEDGQIRSFHQSGTGLAQVISFLFSVTLIGIRNGRKVVVMDEVLNGLHPDAKLIIKQLITDVLGRDFQFVLVEYGLDIGKQYEVKKKGTISSVTHYESGSYYRDLGMRTDEELEEVVK